MDTNRTVVYCDGACSGNQYKNNKGGWGVIVSFGNSQVEQISGGEKNTTNQRMELMACIKALEYVRAKGIDAHTDIYTDSAYVVNCFRDRWYENWRRNGWVNAKKKPVENKDLWRRLLDLAESTDVSFHKVTGHSGEELNEAANELAQKAATEVG